MGRRIDKDSTNLIRTITMDVLLKIENLSAGYDKAPEVIQSVTLEVYENDFLGIIGPNGGGKTTLLKTILGLKEYTSGSISFYNKGVQVNHLNIGYLPQINHIDKKFPLKVKDVILSGMTLRGRLFKYYNIEDKKRVLPVARKMGVHDLLNRPIGELSGGQLQRVLLGRAIIDNPKLIILDEPSSYVDKQFESNFYKILEEINNEMAIVLVSHDVGTIISHVKNIACVNQSLHYHSGSNISQEWLSGAYDSCPFEILGHGDLPHRVLLNHDHIT